jgi:23S rRNA-/tRNA-specific pseudouridylate synthase
LDIDIDENIVKIWTTEQKDNRRKTIGEKLDPNRILFEDSDLLIYDKPSGLIVHSPDHKTDEVSLIEQIEGYLVAK